MARTPTGDPLRRAARGGCAWRWSPARLRAVVSQIVPSRGAGCPPRESEVVCAVLVMAGLEAFFLRHLPCGSGFRRTVPGGEGGGHRSPSRWPTGGTNLMTRSLCGFRRQGVIRGRATAGRGLRDVAVARTGFEEPSTQTIAAGAESTECRADRERDAPPTGWASRKSKGSTPSGGAPFAIRGSVVPESCAPVGTTRSPDPSACFGFLASSRSSRTRRHRSTPPDKPGSKGTYGPT